MSESENGGPPCPCISEASSVESTTSPSVCDCPRDDHEIVVHNPRCDFFKNETFVYPDDCECGIREEIQKTGRDVCVCDVPEGEEPEGIPCECDLPEDVQVSRHICKCDPPEGAKELFEKWRKDQEMNSMPEVLESSHPLMQRFQQSLREFLVKENSIAEDEIQSLKDELRRSKIAYNKDLEDIYTCDHSCNDQRVLIEEYETSLAERTDARLAAEERVKKALVNQKQARDQLNQDLMAEREFREELEALTALCQQLERWHEDTASDMYASKHMSEKMRAEKKALTDEKRELDVFLFWLNNEVWKLESKLEMMRKQMEIKSVEMEKVNEKVAVYATELEDLDLDKRRLVSLWNSALNNISQRDKIFDSVREDYAELQESFRTLVNNLQITKNLINEEIQKGKELEMTKDNTIHEIGKLANMFDQEDARRMANEKEMEEVTEAIDMSCKDQELMRADNFARSSALNHVERKIDRKIIKKHKMESDILANLQDCLLNDKAVQSMANGIRNIREMSRKQEITLMQIESQHAKLTLDIEALRIRQAENEETMANTLASVRKRESEVKELEVKYSNKAHLMKKKQREMDIVLTKYVALKEIFDAKTPQELRIEALERQIQTLRERTDSLQHNWLRQQGHVVRLTEQFQKLMADINLIKNQLQICDQKIIGSRAESDKVIQSLTLVKRNLREMRGRLQVLEKTRKDALERNNMAQKSNVSISQEYADNLKGSEMEIIDLEEEIELLDKDKINLTQELDRFQREALIWQRKGILAVELRKSMKQAKSSTGDIGRMRHEIHKMETRREQLRRTGEKLAEDLALYVRRRETALEKTRVQAAVEKSQANQGQVSQTTYWHKLRLARADVAHSTKQLTESEARLKNLTEEQKHLEHEISKAKTQINKLEEQVASLMKDCREAELQRHKLLERVVRSQRLGSELAIAVRRQTLELKQPKSVIMTQYNVACALNSQIRFVIERLTKEYPYIADKLVKITNTLDIYSPEDSPRFAEAPSVCSVTDKEKENIAEKPLSP